MNMSGASRFCLGSTVETSPQIRPNPTPAMQPGTPIDEAAVFIPAKQDLGALAGSYLTRAQVSVQGTNPMASPIPTLSTVSLASPARDFGS